MDTINVIRAEEGEHWLVGADVMTIRASGRDTSGTLLILEVTVPPGGGPPVLHRHAYAESFRFLEGEFEISTLDADAALSTVSVGVGDTVSIPSMVWHNFKNVGGSPGRFIAIHSPAVMEACIREVGQRIEDPHNPPQPAGPPSEEETRKLMTIFQKYMELLPAEKTPGQTKRSYRGRERF
jgi:mannose-6-phosphate isomerase-like protein (cupin superfamily)